MENKYYVYAHRRPDTREIFYIGKGQRGRAYYFRRRNKYWKRIVKKVGQPTVEYLEIGLTEKEAFEWEKYYITKYKGQLCNMTNGGEGGNTNFGRKYGLMSQEHRDKISAAQKGIKRGPMSEETKEKLSKANIGKKLSEETKRKVSEAKRAYWAKRRKPDPN